MPLRSRSEVLSILNSIIGFEITGIHFIIYEYQQKILETGAFLELSLMKGSFLFFSPAGDGDSLRVDTTSWDDPFAGDISPVNREFIETHGQFKRKDVSTVEPYQNLINHAVDSTTPIVDHGKLVGVRIVVNTYCLSFSVDGDEGNISCEPCER